MIPLLAAPDRSGPPDPNHWLGRVVVAWLLWSLLFSLSFVLAGLPATAHVYEWFAG